MRLLIEDIIVRDNLSLCELLEDLSHLISRALGWAVPLARTLQNELLDADTWEERIRGYHSEAEETVVFSPTSARLRLR